MRVPVSLVAGAAVLLVASTPARAQSEAPPTWDAHWPTSAEDEQDRLGRFLEQERAAELRQYWAVAIGGLAVGAPQIGLGVYMLGQSDVAAQAIGPGMIIGGSVDCLLGVAPLLAPTPMSILRDFHATERASGKPAEQVVRDVEDKWRDLVARQRLGRMIGGLFDLVVGIPAFTTGLVFALAKPGLAGMSSQTQYVGPARSSDSTSPSIKASSPSWRRRRWTRRSTRTNCSSTARRRARRRRSGWSPHREAER
jgi:hypothetical protein